MQNKSSIRAKFGWKPCSSLDSREWDLRTDHTPITDLEFILALLFIQVAVTVQIIHAGVSFRAKAAAALWGRLFSFFLFIQNSRDVFSTVACDGGDIFPSPTPESRGSDVGLREERGREKDNSMFIKSFPLTSTDCP